MIVRKTHYHKYSFCQFRYLIRPLWYAKYWPSATARFSVESINPLKSVIQTNSANRCLARNTIL